MIKHATPGDVTYVDAHRSIIVLVTYICMYCTVTFFWTLARFLTLRPIASPLVPDNRNSPVSCLIWHVLLRSPSSHPSSSVITLSLGICFRSAAWKPHLDIWNYSRLGRVLTTRQYQTGRYLRMLHTQILCPFVLVIDPAWIWTTALSQATSNILSVSCAGRRWKS